MKSILLFYISFLSIQTLAVAPNPKAPKGGNFMMSMDAEPHTLHPIMQEDAYSRDILTWFLMDSLVRTDPNTGEYLPRLAEKWEISKDNKTFTFFLRKSVFFHDGKPVTAEDVKFSFEAVFEPKYRALHKIPYFEKISKAEVVDAHTVKFFIKDSYFMNFEIIGSMYILPKHVYSDVNKSEKMIREIVGSGPYILSNFDQGEKILLKKFDRWYGDEVSAWKGAYNFHSITIKFFKDENTRIEKMEKGELDYIYQLRSEAWEKKTTSDIWGKSAFKKKVENKEPTFYSFIGWNLRNPMFQDKETRLALAHLVNREEMIKKYTYDLFEPTRGPVYNRSEYASPKIQPIAFDVAKAYELLTKAGWSDSNKNGILDKNIQGKLTEFKFTVIYANKDTEKYLALYKEDLKKAKIEMDYTLLDWGAFLKRVLDKGDFEATAMSWSFGSPHWDPKQVWHSSSAAKGGSNFISYKNPEVDKLIDRARVQLNKSRRTQLLQKVYEMIAEDAPYAFLFSPKYSLYAVSNRIEQPGDTFVYTLGPEYWWAK